MTEQEYLIAQLRQRIERQIQERDELLKRIKDLEEENDRLFRKALEHEKA